MSAYIVDDKTINRIVAAAMLRTLGSLGPLVRQFRLVPDNPEPHDWAALGSALRDMNVAAVIARYGPSDSLPGPSPLLPYRFRLISAPSLIQTVKTLACYLYQCSEGDIPEQRLYQQLDNWQAELCRYYVTESDEYDQAEWA